MKRLLEQYQAGRIPIEMIYMAKDETITQRNILVLEVNEKSLTAFCYLRQTKRTFLLQNILSFRPMKKKYVNEVI
ncbi:hypothetical protein M3936_04245 [Sutcliffiella horikoshii]|uniref:hypothetical protein n=1 Tax=Sutcliffiella horikoshii TaxID=79883 RepID=UPI0007D075E6|nr:hypothetical protein [Sutcliffiella horikoshii]MCM3616788.1 hypothetical protein [Sutcliffiella horikoshii]